VRVHAWVASREGDGAVRQPRPARQTFEPGGHTVGHRASVAAAAVAVVAGCARNGTASVKNGRERPRPPIPPSNETSGATVPQNPRVSVWSFFAKLDARGGGRTT